MANHEVVLETHLGSVYVRWVDGELTEICLGELQSGKGDRPLRVTGEPPNGAGERLVEDLRDYFSGKPVMFGDGTIPGAYSSFQKTVWKAAQQIPYGETRSYGWLAESMGRSKTAARAVGTALGKNPVLLVVPCHRVLGANGALTGFAFGMEWKAALLDLEASGKTGL